MAADLHGGAHHTPPATLAARLRGIALEHDAARVCAARAGAGLCSALEALVAVYDIAYGTTLRAGREARGACGALFFFDDSRTFAVLSKLLARSARARSQRLSSARLLS